MSSARASLSRKRNSVGALLPPTVAWLEPLALTMDVDWKATAAGAASGVHYRLSLHPRTGALTPTWTLSRSFDDYRAFQKKLLKLMKHGHFCSAECPWLYTFVKSYFPKKSFFFGHSTCTRLADKRRDALLRCFATLQTFLLNRANHACPVVVDSVATELLHFVLQDTGKDHPLQHQRSFDGFNSVGSGDSFTATSDDEDMGSSTDLESFVCALCDCSLDAEPHNNCSSRGGESELEASGVDRIALPTSLPSVNSSSSASSSSGGTGCGGASYTTTLSCGHQFHDECIVPKLNDAMQCPTCGAAQASH